jgi:hypothetical protein
VHLHGTDLAEAMEPTLDLYVNPPPPPFTLSGVRVESSIQHIVGFHMERVWCISSSIGIALSGVRVESSITRAPESSLR